MPRFETVQARGKHRPIDDGKRFGHNSASGFTETVECCSAFQPVIHARALAQPAALQGAEAKQSQQELETGGKDMPEAYRWVPADPREGALNVIATWSVDDNCWLFREMCGQVFGRVAAVINFHRVQRLLVAMIRRWLLVLCSMYYTTMPPSRILRQPWGVDNATSAPCSALWACHLRSLSRWT